MATPPRNPRFPRKLGDDDWLRKKLAEQSEDNTELRRNFLNEWTAKEPSSGPDSQADTNL
ncbi:hypothetical protein D3C76_36910 [compost metagenome]